MKFTVSSSTLSKHTQKVQGIVSQSNILPILSNFLFSLEGNTLSITATDQETTMTTKLEVQGSKDGSICIDATILSNYLKAVSEQPITFEVTEDFGITIKNNSGKQKLVGQDAIHYPPPIQEEETDTFTIKSSDLVIGLSKCLKGCDMNDRMWSRGVNFWFEKNKLSMCGTDASQLINYHCETDNNGNANFIVPQKSVAQIIKTILPTETSVEIKYNKSNIFINTPDFKITARLLDAEYPKYKNIIPNNNENVLSVNKNEFINSIKISSVFSNKECPIIVLEMAKNELTITSQDVDFGTNGTEKISCEYSGEPITIGFNSKNLFELSSLVDTENIVFQIKDGTKGALIKNENDLEGNEQLFLLMPLLTQ